MATGLSPLAQCQKPRGLLGRLILSLMNASHSKVTDWGLAHISIKQHDVILDVGCGGGRTVTKLAAVATQGKVYGVDYSEDAVVVSQKTNAATIRAGRVEIRHGSVSQLPFSDNMFDLVTAVETHFWWPDLQGGVREILRVLKPGGQLILIAEVYRGASAAVSRLAEKNLPRSGMNLLTLDEHREILANAGYSDVRVAAESGKGWMCALARKS